MAGWSVYSGTTCCAALFIDKKLYVANVGDTRAVLCKKNSTVRLSVDHTVKLVEEVQRVKDLGAEIIDDRVKGMISVTRSIGDSFLHPYVIADPHTLVTEINSDDLCLIIACDGVWDTMNDEKAAFIAISESDAQKAADKLKETAISLGSTDNISVLVLFLQ